MPAPPAPAWGAPAAPAPSDPSVAPAWGAPGAPAPGAPAPAAPAWGQPAPSAPAFATPAPSGPPDPTGFGAAVARLGNTPRKRGRTALAVAGALLEDGEVVEALVVGRVEGNEASMVLTDRALYLTDERQWRPLHERFALDASLQVQGWQDEKTASLTLVLPDRQLVIDQISDRPLAVELAQRIRARTGA